MTSWRLGLASCRSKRRLEASQPLRGDFRWIASSEAHSPLSGQCRPFGRPGYGYPRQVRQVPIKLSALFCRDSHTIRLSYSGGVSHSLSLSRNRTPKPIAQSTTAPPQIIKKAGISHSEILLSDHKPIASHRTAKIQNAQYIILPGRTTVITLTLAVTYFNKTTVFRPFPFHHQADI